MIARNRIFLKAVAVFLMLEVLFNTLAPSVLWALTAGPTAPEFSTFEPVDVTDLVDLKTGDFTYNVPLLEVPGPAGSYPLSLSYHAGIQPDLESSWAGLGFNVNVGSISRFVNGFPDDHYGMTNYHRSYWEGGETTVSTVGVSIGIANVGSVSAGLQFAEDTYRGYGVGMYVGAGLGYKFNDRFSVGLNYTAGVGPYGGSYESGGLSVGIAGGDKEAMNVSARVGINYNSNAGLNVGVGGGVGVGQKSVMNASINSGSSKASLTVSGVAADVHNSKANNVSTESESFMVEIPVYYFNIRLGRDYSRYWIDEKENVYSYGSLYMNEASPSYYSAFDTQDLLDAELDIALHNNPEKVLGGSLPDVDVYTVAAQGIGGNIKPFHFNAHLFQQDKRDRSDGNKVLTKSYQLDQTAERKPVEFRFIHDFSNRFEYEAPDFQSDDGTVSLKFTNTMTTGENGNDGYKNNHLAGSKHVEWYSNQEILLATPGVNPYHEGFINCVTDGFVRNSDKQIGAFSITNASGVTYHFALPVYSFGEYMKNENTATKAETDGYSYNALSKPESYAYTWLLTSVTGPDFVDRNENGLADHGDWGYWLNFEYERWLGDYQWRNPGVGMNRDIDGEFEFFSSGKKELYYLKQIVTDSHVAVFEKSPRNDGREVMDLHAGGFEALPITSPSEAQIQCRNNCEASYCPFGDCDEVGLQQCLNGCGDDEILLGYKTPRPTLKLDRIKLYNYNDFIAQKTSDEFTIRTVEFKYDYSLASGTLNSYSDADVHTKTGKLTLKELKFLGKNNIQLIPSQSFEYKNKPYNKDNYDVWGYYKNDYSESYRNDTNEILGRTTTPTSAQDVDAWSLVRVNTPLGSSVDIEYESDEYEDVGLAKQGFLRIKSVTDAGPGKFKYTFWERGVDLNTLLSGLSTVRIDLLGSFYNQNVSSRECTCQGFTVEPLYIHFAFTSVLTIDEIGVDNSYIILSNNEFYEHLTSEPKFFSHGFNGNKNCPKVYCTDTFSGDEAWPDYFPAGVLSFESEQKKFGGGTRVASVSVSLPEQKGTRSTVYEYSNGVTSYEPFEILAPKIDPDYIDPGSGVKRKVEGVKLQYKRAILKNYYKQLAIARQIPGPGVMYKSVKVREKNTINGQEQWVPNYTEYEFETYTPDMVEVHYSKAKIINGTDNTYDDVTYNRSYLNKVTLEDRSARIGNLKKITLYNALTDEPISVTQNKYLHDEKTEDEFEQALRDEFKNQGLIHETFSRARIAFYKSLERRPYLDGRENTRHFRKDERHMLASLLQYQTYPSIPVGQVNINYQTGITTNSITKSYDFYSGEPTEVINTDSYGNKFVSIAEAAYKHYPQMGLKVVDKNNRHMLTQVAASYSYKVNDEGNPTGLVSASVQTWSDQLPVLGLPTPQTGMWRPHTTYNWDGTDVLNDGTYSFADFTNKPFNWSTPHNSVDWQKTSEITLYNKFSNVLEMKDLNGNYASTRMNKDQNKTIATASNASFNEIAYSGAEYYSANTDKEGGVDRGQGNPSRAHVHTGTYSLLVNSNALGFSYTIPAPSDDQGKKYRASVWVYLPGTAESQEDLDKAELFYSINGQQVEVVHPVLQKNKAKNWYLLNIDITPQQGKDVVVGVRNRTSRGIYLDDFRVQPVNSSLATYVYDHFSGELNYILDNNNFYTRFEYDAMGRLVRTSKELLNFDFGDGKESYRADAVINEVKYNFGKRN